MPLADSGFGYQTFEALKVKIPSFHLDIKFKILEVVAFEIPIKGSN